ncbi:MAG: FHIPEP family type III secretion protein, partial [Rhabdaerophilum calidifontis]
MSDASVGQTGGGLGLRLGQGMSRKDVTDFLKRGDIALAMGVLTILVVLIVPLPPILLDLFLAVSIILSVLILMTSLFIMAPLEFSSFPTILLIATMLRLALNLASTRLILANGHTGTGAAGHVIEAFGSFVMSGNFVIGLIVFIILVIVNFVVITKGSGRIAEVAARFSLDAMPGKQMAIDADLSAGLIDQDEAKVRRKHLEDESAFYGAMDGASKFVRGDAIAGILITFVNIIGGIIIGVAQHGMTFGDASRAYTLLTVGDGLVTQIPALIVSTAAGLLVSKAGVSGAADKALAKQLASMPKALGMSAFVMVVIAILPGMPALPFLGLAGLAGYFAYTLHQKTRRAELEEVAFQALAHADAKKDEAPVQDALKLDELRIEIGYALLPLVQGEGGEDKITEQ